MREGVAKVAPSYFGDFLQGVAGRLAPATTMQKPQNSWDYLAKTDGIFTTFLKRLSFCRKPKVFFYTY
jgi:hypothetical protein